jgi:hypothetical protein
MKSGSTDTTSISFLAWTGDMAIRVLTAALVFNQPKANWFRPLRGPFSFGEANGRNSKEVPCLRRALYRRQSAAKILLSEMPDYRGAENQDLACLQPIENIDAALGHFQEFQTSLPHADSLKKLHFEEWPPKLTEWANNIRKGSRVASRQQAGLSPKPTKDFRPLLRK